MTSKALLIAAIRNVIQAHSRSEMPASDTAVKAFIAHSPYYLPLVNVVKTRHPAIMQDLPENLRALWTWEPPVEVTWHDAMEYARYNKIQVGGTEEEDLEAVNAFRRANNLPEYKIIMQRGKPERLPDPRLGGHPLFPEFIVRERKAREPSRKKREAVELAAAE